MTDPLYTIGAAHAPAGRQSNAGHTKQQLFQEDGWLCKTEQIDRAQPCIVFGIVMTVECCAHCEQPATKEIPANPGHVCLDHALEFWTGLLAYVKERADQCEKEVRPCTCRACVALDASFERAKAIAAAGPPPLETELVPVRRAS